MIKYVALTFVCFCKMLQTADSMLFFFRCPQVASTIQQKKDLGCKTPFDPITVYESKSLGSSAKEFWQHLGGFRKYQGTSTYM